MLFLILYFFRFTLEYPPNPSESPLAAIKYLLRNIDKMPNLTEFLFNFINRQKSGKNTPNNELIEEFVRKIASPKSIKKIFLEKREYSYRDPNYYTKDELKNLFPEIDFNKFHEVKIFYL